MLNVLFLCSLFPSPWRLAVSGTGSRSRKVPEILVRNEAKERSVSFRVAIMDEMYGVPDYADKPLMTPENLIFPPDYPAFLTAARIPIFGSDDIFSGEPSAASASPAGIPRHQDDDVATTVMKAKIASHPHYPRLLQAYIDCQKVRKENRVATIVTVSWRKGKRL